MFQNLYITPSMHKMLRKITEKTKKIATQGAGLAIIRTKFYALDFTGIFLAINKHNLSQPI